jgi:hypothetical protein
MNIAMTQRSIVRVDSALNCTPIGRNDNNNSWSVPCQEC